MVVPFPLANTWPGPSDVDCTYYAVFPQQVLLRKLIAVKIGQCERSSDLRPSITFAQFGHFFALQSTLFVLEVSY